MIGRGMTRGMEVLVRVSALALIPCLASGGLAAQPEQVTDSKSDFSPILPKDAVEFAIGSSAVDATGAAILRDQAKWLIRYPDLKIVVEGHSDERGTRAANMALGLRRARAVKRGLVVFGVAERRISTTSYGEERPADARSDRQGWARNRRAVTVVIEQEGQ